MFKKIFTLVVTVFFVFLGLWIAQDNAGIVTVTLLGFPVEGMSLGLWLLIMLFGGVLLGMLASLPLIIKQSLARKSGSKSADI